MRTMEIAIMLSTNYVLFSIIFANPILQIASDRTDYFLPSVC